MAANEETRARISAIRHTLDAMRVAWPFVLPELTARRDKYVSRLIDAESAEVRGLIKGVGEVIGLPEALASELQQLERDSSDPPGDGGLL